MSRLGRSRRIAVLLPRLRRMYPEAHCELRFSNPLELAVATILSAQCTDKRVNIVTKELFRRYRRAEDYVRARPREIERLIRPAGFYRTKAASIREMARVLVERHRGRVPDTMDELLRLRGVARKTANVILGNAYGKAEGIAVDTHVLRLAYRLGLSVSKDPVRVERELMGAVPRRSWTYLSHALIWHGRRVCAARAPACSACRLRSVCPRRGVRRSRAG